MKVTIADVKRILSKKEWSTTAYITWEIAPHGEFADGVGRFKFFSQVQRHLKTLVETKIVEKSCVRDYKSRRWMYRKL